MVTVARKLKPFRVPNFVVIDEDGLEGKGYPLHALTEEAIKELCDEFVAGVYKKAQLETHND